MAPAPLLGTERWKRSMSVVIHWLLGKLGPELHSALVTLLRLARLMQVTLLRSYRTGELPDIERLTLSSFLAPLSESAC